VTNSLHRDSFKISTNANNAGIGNKLVTIFARHRDNFIMTISFSLICQIFSGSGQILQPRQLYLSPGLAKIAPWWLARRDKFSAKVPGPVSADYATNAYCPYQRAVMCHLGLEDGTKIKHFTLIYLYFNYLQ
jgi:hypothetical protein